MILPLALILLVAAILIVVPGLGFMYSLLTINSNAQQDVAAYYAADSGIQALYWYWNKNPNNITITYLPTILNPINGMTVTVAAVDSQAPDKSYDNYTITSSAASGGKTRAKVIALVHVPAPGNNIFNEAAAALNGNITMTGAPSIISDSTSTGNYGNIYANGNVTVTGGYVGGTSCSSAKGTASATQTAYINSCCGGCAGNSVSNAAAISYTLTISNYTGPADNGTAYSTSQATSWANGGPATYYIGPGWVNGNVTFGGANTIILQGNLHIKGTLTVGGSALVEGPYTIVADGNISIGGGSTTQLVKGNIPFIITQSTDSAKAFYDNSAAISAIIYAPNGAADIEGGTPSSGYTVYGSVIAKSMTIAGSATIEYLTGIHSETQIPGSGLGGTPLLIGYNYQ
jgi:hypothetical protein